MSDKADHKRKLILETARQIFREKGFKDVTMKDIAERAGISRGGLYLYFPSTEEIFLEVLRMEAAESDDTFESALSANATAADILQLFLEEQKKELLQKEGTLTIASYEYAFSHRESEKAVARKRFQKAVQIIEHLIRAGVETDEFYCSDPHAAAADIMYVIEGLKICAQTMGITERIADREIRFIMDGLLALDEM